METAPASLEETAEAVAWTLKFPTLERMLAFSQEQAKTTTGAEQQDHQTVSRVFQRVRDQRAAGTN